ncbi:hypothetical protein [Microvirga alba]|nr:hypothetical protein [Microvirga alba]
MALRRPRWARNDINIDGAVAGYYIDGTANYVFGRVCNRLNSGGG